MDNRRLIDYSAIKGNDKEGVLARNIVDWLRGRPNSKTTRRDIGKWFFGTPDAFVDAAINRGIADGTIGISECGFHNPRRSRVAYQYYAKGD